MTMDAQIYCILAPWFQIRNDFCGGPNAPPSPPSTGQAGGALRATTQARRHDPAVQPTR